MMGRMICGLEDHYLIPNLWGACGRGEIPQASPGRPRPVGPSAPAFPAVTGTLALGSLNRRHDS